jgi:Ca2+-binding EF-hand superfamily protein
MLHKAIDRDGDGNVDYEEFTVHPKTLLKSPTLN